MYKGVSCTGNTGQVQTNGTPCPPEVPLSARQLAIMKIHNTSVADPKLLISDPDPDPTF